MPAIGIVYVLTNPAMPNLVKIGRTSTDDVNKRMKELYSTGVPFEFQLAFACRVENTEEVEKALHIAFAPNRVNPKREFFAIDPGQAIAILKLLHVEDATQEVAGLAEIEQSIADSEQQVLGSRRPNLNFQEMQIPVGSVLVSTVSQDVTATVVGPKKVQFQGTEMSLTAATRIVLELGYSVAPGPYWQFQGKLVRDIYNETYPLQG